MRCVRSSHTLRRTSVALDTGTATSVALDYSTKNGGGVAGGDIQFASNTFANDTIQVRARRTGAGFLSRVLGITTVNLTADAEARAYNLAEATYAAPFGIDKSESFLSGSGCPCYNVPTSFELGKIGREKHRPLPRRHGPRHARPLDHQRARRVDAARLGTTRTRARSSRHRW